MEVTKKLHTERSGKRESRVTDKRNGKKKDQQRFFSKSLRLALTSLNTSDRLFLKWPRPFFRSLLRVFRKSLIILVAGMGSKEEKKKNMKADGYYRMSFFFFFVFASRRTCAPNRRSKGDRK